jgi:hypothetical protein
VLSLIADLFVPGIRWLAAAIGGGLVSFSASGAGEDGLEFTPLDTLAPAQGIFAAQQIKPQARTLAEDRGTGASYWTTTLSEALNPTNSGCSELIAPYDMTE